jgi:hypothetical protein
MSDDLPSVLARVAEKLHGWSHYDFGDRIVWRHADGNVMTIDYLLTGNGMVETMERLAERRLYIGFRIVDTSTTGLVARAYVFDENGVFVGEGASAKKPPEAVARAADAALKEST